MRTPMSPGWHNYGFATGLAIAAISMIALAVVVNINPAPTVQGGLAAGGVLVGAGIALANVVGVTVNVVNKVRQIRA